MEFLEKKVANGYRSGEILLKNGQTTRLDTPACVLYTRGGAAPHLTNDLVDNFLDGFNGVQITLPTMFQHPGPDVLKEYGKGVAEFLDIKKKHFIYCSVHDPTQKTQHSYNEAKNVSVWNSSGRKKVNVELFLEILTAFKPDIVQCLCDTVPRGQSAKRNKKSVDRTLTFLDEVLEYQKNHETLKSVGILGAIEGGDSETERKRSAIETSKRPVSGFVLEGIDSSSESMTSLLHTSICKDDVTRDDFQQGFLMQHCCGKKNLPRDKPRFFPGIVAPDDIFRVVECGVDVFDSSFAYQATQRGCALDLQPCNKRYRPELNHTIDPSPNCENLKQAKPSMERKEDDDATKTRFEIDLGNARYREDFSPFVLGCCCYSCTNHSRAYLYHLLQTKEMLAQVLLMIHNFYQYFQFFKNLREAIAQGNYENFKNQWLES